MWLRFNKRIGCAAKSGLINKLLSGYIVVLILLMSFSMIFVATMGAKEILPVISDGNGDAKIPVVSEPAGKDPVVSEPAGKDPVVSEPVGKDPVVSEPVVEAEYGAKDNNIEIKIETVLGNVSKGDKTEIISENYIETDICSVSFTPSTDLKKVKLTVAKLEDKPEEIIEIPIKDKSVYTYLDIKLTADDEYIGEDSIESMRFEFKVEWSWINENKIHKETVLLMRYHDAEWQNLTTTYLSEDDNYIYYEAETPGLSTFAVVGSELIESSASYVEEVPEVPWILNLGIIVSSSTILFVVLFKARFVYRGEEDDTKGSKKRLFGRKL